MDERTVFNEARRSGGISPREASVKWKFSHCVNLPLAAKKTETCENHSDKYAFISSGKQIATNRRMRFIFRFFPVQK